MNIYQATLKGYMDGYTECDENLVLWIVAEDQTAVRDLFDDYEEYIDDLVEIDPEIKHDDGSIDFRPGDSEEEFLAKIKSLAEFCDRIMEVGFESLDADSYDLDSLMADVKNSNAAQDDVESYHYANQILTSLLNGQITQANEQHEKGGYSYYDLKAYAENHGFDSDLLKKIQEFAPTPSMG